MEKLRIATVRYHNTLPMLYGLKGQLTDRMQIIPADPADCARYLFDGHADISLCPVGALLGRSDYTVISDFAIGTKGAVRTVMVYSHKPLDELRRIILSPASRTSNVLVQVLDHFSWHLGLEFLPANSDYFDENTGVLCIGDDCFEMEKHFAYHTDLGMEWRSYSGLPMVFACWVTLGEIDPEFITSFNACLAKGIEDIGVMELPSANKIPDLRNYLQHNITYYLDEEMRAGLQAFVDRAGELPLTLTNASEASSGQPSVSKG